MDTEELMNLFECVSVLLDDTLPVLREIGSDTEPVQLADTAKVVDPDSNILKLLSKKFSELTKMILIKHSTELLTYRIVSCVLEFKKVKDATSETVARGTSTPKLVPSVFMLSVGYGIFDFSCLMKFDKRSLLSWI